jgi:hypothetical protein
MHERRRALAVHAMPPAVAIGAGLAIVLAAGFAQAEMAHRHGSKPACNEPTIACATKATPTFAPDGTLWLAWSAAGRVLVAHSSDLGRTFSVPVPVNAEALDLDWGPDARPKIKAGGDGRVYVAFARFRDREFNGQVLYSRSTDGGRTFAAPAPITTDPESQRFEAIALDVDGSLFTAWLDKRNRAPARARNEKYVGAALAFSWSTDQGTTVSDARIAQDHTCECCRLGVGFAGPGRPVVVFRNVFDGSIRDHAVTTFTDRQTLGPVFRISVDDWKTDACPHHGPSFAIAPGGTYHVAWFTNGRARRGLFYARSADAGRTFSDPKPFGKRGSSHPDLAATDGTLWLAWKEFDGEITTVLAMASRDNGRTWSEPQAAAQTSGTSDNPLLVTNGRRAFLSWQTQADGYRFVPLENVP